MTTITDGEAGSSVRAKLNASLAKTDQLTVSAAVNLDTIAAKTGHLTVTQAVDLDAIETRVNALDAAIVLKGVWDASAGTFPGSGTAQAGDSYFVSVAGTVNGVDFAVNDRIIAILDNASTTTFAANWFKADYTDQVLSVAGLMGTISSAALKAALGQWVTADYTDSSVTYAKMQLVPAYTVIGNGTGAIGSAGSLTAGTNSVLRRSSGDIGWGKLDGVHLNNNIVTNALAAQMATQTLKGRNAAGTGNPEDLTMTTIVAMLDNHFGNTNWRTSGGAGGLSYYNDTGSTLVKGTPVCLAAWHAGSQMPGIAAADADASGFMPVLGIIATDCPTGQSTVLAETGDEIVGLDTSAYTLNQILYAGNTPGTMTGTRPTSGAIQPVAIVSKVDATTGEIIVRIWEAGNLLIEPLMTALSDETTNLSTGTAKLTLRVPFAMTLTAIRASVNTAPTGSSIIVDVNESGVSILSTKLSIDAASKTSVGSVAPAVISDAALADDAEITVDIDQVGSTVAGKGLKLTFYGYRT